MFTSFAAWAALAVAAEGNGSATIVWMQQDVPGEDVRAKAERIIGASAAHAAWSDVAFPTSAAGKADDERLNAVARARTDSRNRWDQFDVEGEIAAAIGAAVAPVEIVRDDKDRRTLAEALLLQGAAVIRIVPDAKFATAEEVAPYRVFVGSTALPKPMVDALALDPEAVWTRDDLPDAASWARLSAVREELKNQAQGRLELAAMPAGTSVVLDGHTLPANTQVAPLPPGHHYVHLVVDGRVVGRRTLDATPDTSIVLEPQVSREELAAAGSRVLEGSIEVPDDLAKAVAAVGQRGGRSTPTFLAALDAKGAVKVLPFGSGAAIVRKPAVTVILSGSGGGGILSSQAFAGEIGSVVTAPAISGDLGVEVGVYNLAFLGGTTLMMTPTEEMLYLNQAGDDNERTRAYFRPYGGLGVYLPRPDAAKPLFLLAVDYGWMSPGALGVGGRLSFGVPLGGDGTWFRMDLDAFRGSQMEGFRPEGTADVFGVLRLGFGRKL